MQINQIANNLEPELLGDSKQIDSGAPTLAADGKTIIGGNGRVMAINLAYEQGNGEHYRQYLMDNAEQFGLNPADIQAMERPVLVRRFTDAGIDTNKAAVASNEGGGLGMSALEQARVDAERLPDFGSFVPSENGELNTPANRGFIRDFVGSMPTTVQAQMVGADGQLSQDGIRRLRNAMLYRAYGNSPALSRMVESTDAGLKNMVNAMMQAAPAIAKAKNHIKDGAMHDADISADIVSAVEKINEIHERGGSVADYLAQQGMFEDDLSPVARDLIAFFDEHKRSAKAISTLLKNYYDLLAAQGNPAEADMFGGAQTPDKHQLLQESIKNYEQQHGRQEQRGIFDRAEPTAAAQSERRPAGESVSDTQPQPDSGGVDEAGVGENAGGIGERQRVAGQDSDGLKQRPHAGRGKERPSEKKIFESSDKLGFADQNGINTVRTVSGRETLPMPDHYQNHEYQTENALGRAMSKYWKAWDMWLMREAFTEAQANRDTVNAQAFKRNYNKAANEKKGYAFSARGSVLSESDRETATNYLFKDGLINRDPFYEDVELEDGSGKFSRSESTRQKYEQRIDELFNGAKAEKFGGVTVLDRSDMLDMLGYGDMPLRLVEGKVIAGQTNHPLMTAEVWKKIPDWVDSPAMVFDSDTDSGRLVFIAPEKVRGNDVRIIIEPNGRELNASVLVNAYDNQKAPYLRWANDRLLRYVDKTKAAGIDERFGRRLPDILKNPSLAPNAQIHGMGRGNTKDLRLGKILTEKNLQGYRKNNPDTRFDRGESRPSEISDNSYQRISELESAIASAVGRDNARLIDVVSLDDISRPDNAEDLLNAQGWYDTQTGRITLIADNLPNADTAKFVAWHELAHRKIHVEGLAKWSALLRQADGNTAVKSLADAVMKQRRGYRDSAAANRIAAVEEAIAELYAAKQENNLEALERKYGISLPAAFKDGLGGYLARVAERIKNILKDALGIGRDAFSDGQVFGLLRRIDAVKPSEKGAEPLAENGLPPQAEGAEPLADDTRYSLSEDAQSDFARAVDDAAAGKPVKGYVGLGTTPDALKVIGLPDVKVTMHGSAFKKVMGGKHNLNAQTLKQLPAQLNNPVAVMNSSFTATKQDGYVVLTELIEHENGKDKPVIAALHLNKTASGIEVLNIASVYGRRLNQIQQGLDNELLYWNKEKGLKFLKTFGLQLPAYASSDSALSNSNIKTEADLAQDESKFSRTSDGQRKAYEEAKAAGKTELTFGQWRQVRTPAFKRWFGDWEHDPDNASKVINPRTGEPLVVYHGTKKSYNSLGVNTYDFTEFKTIEAEVGGSGKGFYFTDDSRVANEFSGSYLDEHGTIYPVFLNIREPLDIDAEGNNWKYIPWKGDSVPTNSLVAFAFNMYKKGGNKELNIPAYDGAFFRNVVEGSGSAKGGSASLVANDYVAFSPNQIKSATANSGSFSADNDDIRYSNGKADMGKKERGWFNEMGELNAGLAAYNKLSEIIKPAAEAVGLASGYHKNFTQYMRDYQAGINTAGRTAKQIAAQGEKLSKAEREFLSDVLEKELPEGAEVSPEIQELAQTVRAVFNQQSDDLVALNMLSAESAERFRDTYLPRMYNKADMLPEDIRKMQRQFNRARFGGLGKSISGTHLKGRGIFKEVNRGEMAKYEAQGFELREDYGNNGKKAGKVLMWRDYTKAERAAMGEERDAMLRFSTGYIKTQADIAKGMLFKRIATDENLASITPVEGWVQVSDAVIAGTGGVKRYGALAGMWVHPDIQVALANQFYIDSTIQKVWRSMLGWWKINKTVYNSVAHVNNVISNIVMTITAGANPQDIAAGAIAVKNKNALYQEALEYGLVGEAVDVAGIREMFTGLNNVSDGQMTDLLITRALKRADRLTLGLAGKTAKIAEKAYRAEDEVFRLALYKKARDKGLAPKEAADFALTFMFDYSDVPPTIRKVRDTGILPFVSYTYKALPAIARLALTRPHRMLAMTSLMYGLNALSYLLLGEDADEEEEREYMPDYQKGFTSFGTPKLIRLPWNDSDGKPMFLDIYRWLPLGDFADIHNQMGGLPFPQWATPNGPVINHAMALLANKDTFTGDEIVKDYQSAGEKATVYGKWIARQWLPASVGVPFSYHTDNLLDGLKNRFEGTKFADVLEAMSFTGTNSRGDEKQLYRAAWGSFGVKIRGENPQVMRDRKVRNIAYQIREVRADMRRISRDKSITESARDSKMEARREYIRNLQGRLPGSNQAETD